MAKRHTVSFHEYRYQLLPTTQHIQLDIEGSISSIEDLKRKKNAFLAQVLSSLGAFSYSRGDIRHKVLMQEPLIILQIGVERDLRRKTREFEIEEVENWPTVYAVFENDPAVQKCLVQERGGFQHTRTVVKIIEQSINPALEKYQLAIAFEPIYSEGYFWDLVEEYKGRITQLEFELISPNMSNISQSLSIDLATLTLSTNTQRTNLQLNSDPNSSLTPSADDPTIAGLVRYSSEGGGDITMRATGVRKKIHTAKGVNEVSVNEVLIEGATLEQLAGVFGDLLK